MKLFLYLIHSLFACTTNPWLGDIDCGESGVIVDTSLPTMYGGLWLPRSVGSGVLVVDVSGEDPLLSDESSYSVTTQMVVTQNKYNYISQIVLLFTIAGVGREQLIETA